MSSAPNSAPSRFVTAFAAGLAVGIVLTSIALTRWALTPPARPLAHGPSAETGPLAAKSRPNRTVDGLPRAAPFLLPEPAPGMRSQERGPGETLGEAAPATSAAPSARPLAPDPDGVRRVTVPILLYHHVSPVPPDSEAEALTTVSPEALDAHLGYLRDASWRVIALPELVAALADGAPLPPRAVALTFDDNWRDQYQHALPVLKRHRAPATFFVVTDPPEAGWIGSMGWRELRFLAEAGMTLGAHTRSHRDLRGLSDADLAEEVQGATDLIADRLGERPDILAYPYGHHDARVEAAAAAAGFRAAVTANPDGPAAGDRLLALPRIAVRGDCVDGPAFAACVGPWLEIAAREWEMREAMAVGPDGGSGGGSGGGSSGSASR